MKKSIMYLFARTPVHVGAGNSVGAVDSPVMRERHTRIPIIPGSALKGVLSDLWNETVEIDDKGKVVRSADGKRLFGEDDNGKDAVAKAGTLLIGEARVLAFPVRSAKGMFAWVTCPLVLSRYARDAGVSFEVGALTEMDVLAGGEISIKEKKVVLEEYVFNVTGKPSDSLLEVMASIEEKDNVWKGVKTQLAVVSNELFQHFCEHACDVVTRIKIDDATGVVAPGALFNQEQVPSETMFYAVVHSGDESAIAALSERVEKEQLIQVGGDATTGLGFCSVQVKEVK